jgi:hypothetical protein
MTYEELWSLTDAELDDAITTHHAHERGAKYSFHVTDYMEEKRRRQAERLSRQVQILAWLTLLASVVGVLAAIAALRSAG